MNENNSMSQNKLILIALLFFFVSVTLLFWKNDRGLNPDLGKNWWTLSFVSPNQNEKLDFLIENHSDKNEFSYEVRVGKELIMKNVFIAKSKEKTTVRIPSIKPQSERVQITVTAGTEKKEIYR